MNRDGSKKRRLLDYGEIISFYNDSYRFIYIKDYVVYKSDIDGNTHEFILDERTIEEEYSSVCDFNPHTEELLLLIAEEPRTTNILATYRIQAQEIHTLSIAEPAWIYLRPQFSNDYSKIAFVERNYDAHISRIVILEQGTIKELVCLTDEDEGKKSPVDQAIAFMEEHFNQPISVRNVAEAIHVSYDHLAHLFKSQKGSSIHRWLNTLRIDKAKVLLRRSGLAIKEIAWQTGFKDQNYFCRVFRKYTGISPQQYRNNSRQD
jgi:AraC-like DNA-binding protein